MTIEMLWIFIKGFIIGLSIAAPVGPIAVLCIQRTITRGFKSGFATAMGAATADGFYGAIAAFGLSIIYDFLIRNQLWFQLFGGLLLLYFGIKTFYSDPADNAIEDKDESVLRDYLSTTVLTASNPMTIIGFIAVFAGFGITYEDTFTSVIMVSGVFLGSAFFQALLCSGAWFLKDKICNKFMSKLSGTIVIIFSIIAVGSIFWR